MEMPASEEIRDLQDSAGNSLSNAMMTPMNPSEAEVASPAPQAPSKRERTPEAPYKWIEDHGLLRDEGVITGLVDRSGEALVHKLDCIRHYHDEKAEAAQAVQTRFDEQLAALGERRQRAVAEAEARPVEEPKNTLPNASSHYLLRYVAGGVLALLACAFNYALIYELLDGHFERPGIIAGGVLIAGMFMLSQPTSRLFISERSQHDDDRAPEGWKQWLIEIGVPIAAALFATVWSFSELGLAGFLVTFLFIAFLFFAGGKLLLTTLANLPLLAGPLGRAIAGWRRRRKLRAELERIDAEVADVEERRSITESVEIWKRRSLACQELFLSEYHLAAEARTHRRLAASTMDINTTSDGGNHEVAL
jgi:hypothetical protein